MSFEYHHSKGPKERGLRLRPSKCLHIYKYYQHPIFGFMNARLACLTSVPAKLACIGLKLT
jgi:hypothetical protein